MKLELNFFQMTIGPETGFLVPFMYETGNELVIIFFLGWPAGLHESKMNLFSIIYLFIYFKKELHNTGT